MQKNNIAKKGGAIILFLLFEFSIRFLESLTPREADFHRVGLGNFSHFQFDFSNFQFIIYYLIFGVFDSTRGWFLPCWTWKIFGFSIWFLESMTPREDDFHCVGLEKFSDFQFYFWSVWLNERLFSNVLDLKIFRIFNLILWVYDATGGWFTLYWTWIFFWFSIWFLGSLTPREADFHRVGLEIFLDFQFDFLSLWLHAREADFHRDGLENFSDFQFDFWSLWRHERLISTVLD